MYSATITVATLVYLHYFLFISASAEEPCSNFTFDYPSSQQPNVRVTVNGLSDGEYIPGNTYTSKPYWWLFIKCNSLILQLVCVGFHLNQTQTPFLGSF